MRSSFRRAVLNSPHCQLHGGGARRHPHPLTDVPHAGRQAPAQLSAIGKKTGSTHTNRSPINPVPFTWGGVPPWNARLTLRDCTNFLRGRLRATVRFSDLALF